MDANQVRSFVEEQIAGRWDETNHHNVDLRRSLVPPARVSLIFRKVINGKIDDEIIAAWLVLEEKPGTKDGYKIIFSEDRMMFGLASEGFPEDRDLVLTGFYGDFWATFEGM